MVLTAPSPKPKAGQSDRKPLGPIVAEWLYYDAAGNGAHRVTRHTESEGKTYRVWHVENGQWVSGLGSQPRALYRLPELLHADPSATVYIAEGEKCADALARIGLIATTNMNGAQKWHLTPEANRRAPFAGRRVVILPDNDAVGADHAQKIAEDLYGVAEQVKIVSLPGVGEKGDIGDWLTLGGTREQLESLVALADNWTSATDRAPDISNSYPQGRYRLLSRAELRNLPSPMWLIAGMLPLDALSFLVGAPRSYKSFLALAWACCVATNTPWLGRAVTKSGPVVYLAGEGLGGINKRITAWEVQHGVVADALYTIGEAVSLLHPESVAELIVILKAISPTPIIVFIDTLSRAMVGGDPLSSKEVMLAISAADRIRREVGCHVLIVHHKNKSDDILGSISIPGGADTIIDIAADGEDLVVSCAKQKDFDEFKPIDLQVVPMSVDDDPLHDSQVLVAADKESEAAVYHLTRSQRMTLEALTRFSNEGALATEWEKASVQPGVSNRSFYNARDELIKKGFVELQPKGASRRYQITMMGHDALALQRGDTPTATPAIALQVQRMQSRTGTPPIKGGSQGLPEDDMQRPAFEEKSQPTPFLKPLPKGPCGKCKTEKWGRLPNGKPICATCHPPSTWQKIS